MSLRTVGVEEELLLVDPDSGAPRAAAPDVLAPAEDRDDEDLAHELQKQQVEIASSPCERLGELAEDLQERRAEAARAAHAEGVAAVALATSPVSVRPTVSDDPRYRRLVDRLGLPAREQLTCGCHVHIAVDSPAEGVAVLDRIRPWLAPLLALSANSPFWQQTDTGFASYRHQAWGRFPSAGPTELFGTVEAYEAAVTSLVATEALLDRAMIYFSARLSAKFPTVEIRVADVCLWGADAVLIAGLARGLVRTAATEWRAGEGPDPVRIEMLRVADWTAAKNGLEGTLIDPRTWRPAPAWTVIDALVHHVSAALQDSGDLATVLDLVHGLRRRGSGAQWQRAHLAAGGDWAALVRDAVGQAAAPIAV